MNGTLENRVLGRVLAVEEIVAVSGAKPTSPCRDNLTDPTLGDTRVGGDCGRSEQDRDASVLSITGVMLDQDSRR